MEVENLIREVFLLSDDIQIPDSLGPGGIEEWDSLGHVNLMSAIENTFDVTIDIDEMMDIESVSDIRSVLEKKVGKKVA